MEIKLKIGVISRDNSEYCHYAIPENRAQDREKPRKIETVATLPGDFGLIPIAEALKSTTSRTGGKPNVIARGPEPCSPGISRARSRIGPGSLATVSRNVEIRGVHAAGNGPSSDRKCWQRLELGIHGLNRWTVKCLEMSRKRGVQTDKTPRERTDVLAMWDRSGNQRQF